MAETSCSERTWAPRVDVPASGPVQHVCNQSPDHPSHRGTVGHRFHRCSCGYTWRDG